MKGHNLMGLNPHCNGYHVRSAHHLLEVTHDIKMPDKFERACLLNFILIFIADPPYILPHRSRNILYGSSASPIHLPHCSIRVLRIPSRHAGIDKIPGEYRPGCVLSPYKIDIHTAGFEGSLHPDFIMKVFRP